MANLYFPQLPSGALAQYPIRKTRTARTIKNILTDGSMILMPDPDGASLRWDLSYTDLSSTEVSALQAHFAACAGPLREFIFIDPTDNMLVFSSDLNNSAWHVPASVQTMAGLADPFGGTAAIRLTNTGQTTQDVYQTVNVPANFQYCFSFYVISAITSTLTIRRAGPAVSAETNVAIETSWRRIVSSGQLNDDGIGLSVAITLLPGQQVQIYGLQLEAQKVPSRYRPTSQRGGVYSSAHWITSELAVIAQGPDQFSTSFSIETSISG